MVEVFKAIGSRGSVCHFGDNATAAAWAGARGRVERVMLPEPPTLGLVVDADDPYAAVFNVLGIGSASRSLDVLLVNIENMQRRMRCLQAIEREFFTVQTPPDPDEDGDEPGEECLLRWADDPADYVERFRAALPGAVARGVLASDEAQAHDARRYRFLRDAAHPDTNGGLRCVGNCAGGGPLLHISGRDLDRAVDAALDADARVDPTACSECIGMGCEACSGTGDAPGAGIPREPQQENQ